MNAWQSTKQFNKPEFTPVLSASYSKEDVLRFLDEKHNPNIVNMFELVPELISVFNCSTAEAKRFVSLWLSSFSERFLARQNKTQAALS